MEGTYLTKSAYQPHLTREDLKLLLYVYYADGSEAWLGVNGSGYHLDGKHDSDPDRVFDSMGKSSKFSDKELDSWFGLTVSKHLCSFATVELTETNPSPIRFTG